MPRDYSFSNPFHLNFEFVYISVAAASRINHLLAHICTHISNKIALYVYTLMRSGISTRIERYLERKREECINECVYIHIYTRLHLLVERHTTRTRRIHTGTHINKRRECGRETRRNLMRCVLDSESRHVYE